MASRQAIFGIANEPVEENDKLVELFKNRAELKKEFAALGKEKYRLQQLIKEREGAIARVIQRLEHLESLLVDPEWVHSVVVFYQLRSLNRRCRGKLAKFAEQLKQQREDRLREGQLKAWRGKRDAEKGAIEKALATHREQLRLLEDQIQSERHRVESMSGGDYQPNVRRAALDALHGWRRLSWEDIQITILDTAAPDSLRAHALELSDEMPGVARARAGVMVDLMANETSLELVSRAFQRAKVVAKGDREFVQGVVRYLKETPQRNAATEEMAAFLRSAGFTVQYRSGGWAISGQ